MKLSENVQQAVREVQLDLLKHGFDEKTIRDKMERIIEFSELGKFTVSRLHSENC